MKKCALALVILFSLCASPAVWAEGNVSGELKPVRSVAPKYPRAALAKKIEGCVVLRFTITDQGVTDNFEILDSQPAGVFDEVALKALYATKFRQPLKAGRYATNYVFMVKRSGRKNEDVRGMCKPLPSHAELNPPVSGGQ